MVQSLMADPRQTGPGAPARLVVVSNRVPAEAENPGGLAVALKDALSGRESLWFGWSGETRDEPGEDIRTVTRGTTTYAVTDLSAEEHDRYYAGYSNRALWPAFHYRLDLGVFDETDFEIYQAVNARFARLLAPLLREDDLVWVHDYHLIPLAGALRALGVRNPIGFFSHIPFPPPELFRAIPQHAELARGLMACSLIGFQGERDRANFERYLIENANGVWMPDGRVQAFGRAARARAFPIGIDVDAFQHEAAEATHDLAERLKASSGRSAIIVGVDRMDYSKGLPERLVAVEDLLARHPELRGRATLLQIAPVSRGDVEAYAQLRAEIELLVSRINGEYAMIDWAPIHYMVQPAPRAELAGLLRLARVGLVTPLRDGMNLVAKEYVAAQDPDDPGVLVLSEFAGAAEQLTAALIVNPHDVRDQADSIHRALEMPLEERRERHADMMAVLRRADSAWWCASFLEALGLSRAEEGTDDLRSALSAMLSDGAPGGKAGSG